MQTIIEAVTDYVEGMIHARPERILRAMHPRACSVGHAGGILEWDEAAAFAEACARAGPPPAGASTDWKILSVEEFGTIAVVRLEDDYLGDRYTDILTLLRFADGWKIIGKAFHQHR